MKIALVRPQVTMGVNEVRAQALPPLGLAYLAAYARRAGHDVTVVDAVGEAIDQFTAVPGFPDVRLGGLTPEQVASRIPRDTELLGFACMFSMDWPSTRRMIEVCSAALPNSAVVAGGEHITACPEYVMQDCRAIDYAVLGEGELTLAELAQALEGGGDPTKIAGLACRDGAGLRRNPERPRVKDVDSFPYPAWDLFPLRNYIDRGEVSGLNLGRSIPMLASRGCPFECTFCSNPLMWTQLWKARDQQQLLAEMKHWMQQYQVSNFDFYDLTAIVRKDWIVKMADLIIESGLDITWQLPVGTRSEALDAEVTQKLRQSGCRYLSYAPESGSTYILKRIKKQINKPKMLQSIRGALRADLIIKANIIVGLPDEKLVHVLESYWFSIQMAVAGMHDISFYGFSPYPGSALFERLRSAGALTLNDAFFYGLVHNRRSFSDGLPSWSLPLLRFAGMAVFYATSFALRPSRVLGLIRALWSGKALTRGADALLRVKRHRRRAAARLALSRE